MSTPATVHGASWQRGVPRAQARKLEEVKRERRRGKWRTPADVASEVSPRPRAGGLRVVMDPGEETFTDSLLGPQVQSPSRQCGDLLLRDRLGNWTYQFAVVVDDLRHDVDLIIRGEDLLASTGRRIQSARMLGRTQPVHFVHHPLIRKPSGEKLSKASRDTSVRDLRAGHALSSHKPLRGEEIIGRAAQAVGLVEGLIPLPADQVAELFRGRARYRG